MYLTQAQRNKLKRLAPLDNRPYIGASETVTIQIFIAIVVCFAYTYKREKQ